MSLVPWGRATYTLLILPPDAAAQLAAFGTKRVEGEINDYPVNLALSRAPVVEGVFLWTGKTLLERFGVKPGEEVTVRLRPAPADLIDMPDDLAAALRAAGQDGRWEALTPGKRRGLLHPINTAKTAATRDRRIAKLVAEVAASA